MNDRHQSNALLQDVIDDADLKLRAVGDITGYDFSTISRFCIGDRHAPLDLWRKLFAATADLRIPAFILAGSGYAAVRIVPPAGFGDDRDGVQALAVEMREHCQAVQRACDIVCDGITPDDRRKLPLLEKEVDEAISALYGLKQFLSARVADACASGSNRRPARTPPRRCGDLNTEH